MTAPRLVEPTLLLGDCREVLRTLPERSVSAVCTDPPSSIHFMGRDWDSDKGGRAEWVAWLTEVMTECRRVLRPGGYAFVWALPRRSHWTALALEDAGFEIREKFYHLFGSGFPKSRDISKDLKGLPWCACASSAESLPTGIGAVDVLTEYANGATPAAGLEDCSGVALAVCVGTGTEPALTGTEDVPVKHELPSTPDADSLALSNSLGLSATVGVVNSLLPPNDVRARTRTGGVPCPLDGLPADLAGRLGNDLRSRPGHGEATMELGVKDRVRNLDPIMLSPSEVTTGAEGHEIAQDVGAFEVEPEPLRDQVMGQEIVGSTAVGANPITSDHTGSDSLPLSSLVGPPPPAPRRVSVPAKATPVGDGHTSSGTVNPFNVAVTTEIGTANGAGKGTATRESGATRTGKKSPLHGCETSPGTVNTSSNPGLERGVTLGANLGNHAPIISERQVLRCTACSLAVRPSWIYEGIGTATKPAAEEWILCRAPLAAPSVAANILAWGCGGLNIAATRVGADGQAGRWPSNAIFSHIDGPDGCAQVGTRRVKGAAACGPNPGKGSIYGNGEGIPALPGSRGYVDDDGLETVPNFVCAPGCSVAALDAQSGERPGSKPGTRYTTPRRPNAIYNGGGVHDGAELQGTFGYGDRGGASRFFQTFHYCPKSSRSERSLGLPEGVVNDHPTCKPLNLMKYLARLTCPPGGTILDPFLGSGTTGAAAVSEGFHFIGIEQDAHYLNDIARHRIAYWQQVTAIPAPAPARRRASRAPVVKTTADSRPVQAEMFA